jgi:hypothetical protein
MKQFFIFLGMLIALTTQIQAQGPGRPRERMEAMRTAFITNKLNLTPEEAQQFWPVYNQMDAERRKLQQKYRPETEVAAMSDAEAEKFLNAHFTMEEEMVRLKREYYQRLRKTITVRKLAMLPRIEHEFRQELVETLRERRAGAGGPNRQ